MIAAQHSTYIQNYAASLGPAWNDARICRITTTAHEFISTIIRTQTGLNVFIVTVADSDFIRWRMTAQPRHAGRPVRDEEIGRNVILEKTRLAMRERPRADLQRNEIARYAGVTPALISYYFPDRSHLFEAAAHPVIETYVADVRLIIGSDRQLIQRLHELIFLFVKFNHKEGHLLDFYLEHTSKTGNKHDIILLEGIYRELLTFFNELIETKTIRGESAGVIQSMLWGMCKHSARRPELNPGASAVEIDDFIRTKANVLSDYFLHGAVSMPSERS